MVKWKGRQTGPYTLSELNAKVASREIKGIYEVLVDGEWKTVRVFLKGLPSSAPSQALPERSPELIPAFEAPAPPRSSPPPVPDGYTSRPHENEWRQDTGWGTDQGERYEREPMLPDGGNDRVVLVYSGFWMRALAGTFDHLLITLLPLWVISRLVEPGGSSSGVASNPLLAFSHLGFWGVVIVMLGSILTWIYFAAMESSQTGGTLGKMMLGLVVTSEDGERITFQKATSRYFSKILSGLMIGAGFFLAAFTRKKQAFHDILTHCTVNLAVRESRILEGSERLTNQPHYG